MGGKGLGFWALLRIKGLLGCFGITLNQSGIANGVDEFIARRNYSEN